MAMKPSKLSDHTFVKGRFITPFNSIPGMTEVGDEKSWPYGRLPEYIWMGLILEKFGRRRGLEALYKIIIELHRIAPSLRTPRLSSILSMPDDNQSEFYNVICNIVGSQALNPLTLICTRTEAPVFSSFFFSADSSIENRQKKLIALLQKLMDHQSNESTDIRFVVLYFGLLTDHIVMQKKQLDLLLKYPYLAHSDEEMRMIRPLVRSAEQMLLEFEPSATEFLKKFWRGISEMTDCKLFQVCFPSEQHDIALYMERVHEVFSYLSDMYTALQPLDTKMSVIVGLATYSYKRLRELYDYQLFNSIAGRGVVRVMIEVYITLKYLIANEKDHENIWKDFQLYGLGLYKLVLTRHREKEERPLSHFDASYIELLVNEFRNEEFLNMDTKYFDKQNIRLKAENVGEKDLYGLYYDYDSSYEHALWGAIRESTMLKCDNPAHQYHIVPDVEGQLVLKSVLADCVLVMNKTISFIRELYGLPEALYSEVISFEKQFDDSESSSPAD